PGQIFFFCLLLVFYGVFLPAKIPLPAALDLPRQIENGYDVLHGHFDVLTKNVYSYIEPDQRFANHHWFFGVMAYLMQKGIGWDGISIFKILFILFTFSLLFWTALTRSDFWTVAFWSVPAIFILQSRNAFRPEIFSYFFVVLFLSILL